MDFSFYSWRGHWNLIISILLVKFFNIAFMCCEIIGIDYFNKVIITFTHREIIGIEYLNEVREMNHWAFGPHHMWTDIVTGDIIR